MSHRQNEDPLRQYRFRFNAAFQQPKSRSTDEVQRWLGEQDAGPLQEKLRQWVESRLHDWGLTNTLKASETVSALRMLGEYRLIKLEDQGGMGVIYQAWDTNLDRHVAIKRIKPGMEIELSPFFAEEIRLTARHRHPGIPAVYSSGTDNGQRYFVMEWIEGQTLDELLSDKSRTRLRRPDDLVGLFARICEIVGTRHTIEHPIIHCDITPRNIKIDSNQGDRVVVLDWGLSQFLQAASDPKRIARRAGTPTYQAPEQHEGISDCRTDVYQLGCVLDTMLDIWPTQESALWADLEAVVEQCQQSDPANRPHDAMELVNRIRTLQLATDQRRRETDIARSQAELKVARLRERQRWLMGGVVGVAILVFLGLFSFIRHRQAIQAETMQRYNKALYHKEAASKVFQLSFKRHRKEAIQYIQQASTIFQQLVDEHSDEPSYQYQLAECEILQGWVKVAEGTEGNVKSWAEASAFLSQAETRLSNLIQRYKSTTGPLSRELAIPVSSLVTDLELCYYFQATLFLCQQEYSKAFELFDKVYEESRKQNLVADSRPRISQVDVLRRMTETLTQEWQRLSFPGMVNNLILYRDATQYMAEQEQAKLPWSRGPTADPAKAKRLATRLAESHNVEPRAVYNAACVFAVDASNYAVSSPERIACVRQANQYLERLRKEGYFLKAQFQRELLKDADLESLQSTTEFQSLIDLVKKQQPIASVTGWSGVLGLTQKSISD